MGEQEEDRVLRPWQVAELAGVEPRTITRWANLGKISSFRTLGGQRRFRQSVVTEELRALGALKEAS